MDDGPLVSVIVPAFNATRTLPETLHSISQQTYRNLEIVVVDDGSTDDTAALVQRHSADDRRFRLISKRNGGVASARNAGIRASKGEFVAFIDADDLWHPTKIAKQTEALLAGGPEMALVYSPFRSIDAGGRVVGSPRKYGVSGWVIHRHFHTNLIGNGSAFLVRRKVLDEFGGFDPWLRNQRAEGCEDLLLQLRIAARYRFGEVSEYLVGYRRLPGNMSSNAEQMIRSGILAVSRAFAECRDVPGLSASAMLSRYKWQRLKIAAKQGRLRESMRLLARQFVASPGFVLDALWKDALLIAAKLGRAAWDAVRGRLGLLVESADARRHFYDFDPKADIDLDRDDAMARALRRLAKLDQDYQPQGIGGMVTASRRVGDASAPMLFSALGPRELRCSSRYREG